MQRQNEGGGYSLFYGHADGNNICIQLSAHGALTYTPNWNKEFEKSTPGFDLMFKAISKVSEDIAAA